MRDYIVKSKIKIKFGCTVQTKGTDKFDAEAKVEKIIQNIILNNEIIKSLIDSNEAINIIIESKTKDLESTEEGVLL